MAKNKETNTEETALATIGATAGALQLDDFAKFIGDGFSSIDSVLIGDPDEGKQALYLGQLIGPAPSIEMQPDDKGEIKYMKAYAFHPLTKTDDGRPGVATNVTHIVPCSYIMASACERIHGEAEKKQKTAIVGFIYDGMGKTRIGRQLKKVRVFEKYV